MSKTLTFEEFEALMRVAGYSLRVRRKRGPHGWVPIEVRVDDYWLHTFDVPAELTEDWVTYILTKVAESHAEAAIFDNSERLIGGESVKGDGV